MNIGTLSGEGFHEGAFTVEQYKKGLQRMGFYTDEDLYISYMRKKQEIRQLAECAKIFILEHWEKVDDWSELNIVIKDRDGNETEFYNYEARPEIKFEKGGSSRIEKMFERFDKRNKEKHNPVKTFEEPVLDTVDGDFSVTINGQDFLWLEDEEIMEIAGYIEYRLREENK